MKTVEQLAGTETFQDSPLLRLARAALMTHLNSRPSIGGFSTWQPSCNSTAARSDDVCTLASIVVGLKISNLCPFGQRARIARAIFVVNNVIQLPFALGSHRPPWLYSLFKYSGSGARKRRNPLIRQEVFP